MTGKTALVLGGAQGVQAEWAAAQALGHFDYVVACNDAITIWPGRLDAAVSHHPEKLGTWRNTRRAKGYEDALRYYHNSAETIHLPWAREIDYRIPGQSDGGSSGLFAVKVALIDLGADRAVLCGIPLTRIPHFFDQREWKPSNRYREVWATISDEYAARMRSMGGWTASRFGKPTAQWIATGDTSYDVREPIFEEGPAMKHSERKIIYEPHPVTPERKRELLAAGYRILDARFAPDSEDMPPVADRQQAMVDNLAEQYQELAGKAADRRWGDERLQAEIDLLLAAPPAEAE